MTRINIKRVKAKKKMKFSTFDNKALDLWRKIGRTGICEVCGKPARDNHHFIGRKNRTLRWDLRNKVELCFQDHTGGSQSAHNDSPWFNDWFKEHRPEDYEYLEIQKHTIWDKDYDKVLKYLKEVS